MFCVSKDPPAAQLKWKEKLDLKIGLLSDQSANFLKSLGMINEKGGTIRSHFVAVDGKIAGIEYKVKPDQSCPLALETISAIEVRNDSNTSKTLAEKGEKKIAEDEKIGERIEQPEKEAEVVATEPGNNVISSAEAAPEKKAESEGPVETSANDGA